MDLITLRTALLITLSILLVIVMWQRFRRSVMAKDLPAPQHAELIKLEVAYHPVRLIAVIHLPSAQRIATSLADEKHQRITSWAEETLEAGTHRIERSLPELSEGSFHFEVATATQRTIRRFRHQP